MKNLIDILQLSSEFLTLCDQSYVWATCALFHTSMVANLKDVDQLPHTRINPQRLRSLRSVYISHRSLSLDSLLCLLSNSLSSLEMEDVSYRRFMPIVRYATLPVLRTLKCTLEQYLHVSRHVKLPLLQTLYLSRLEVDNISSVVFPSFVYFEWRTAHWTQSVVALGSFFRTLVSLNPQTVVTIFKMGSVSQQHESFHRQLSDVLPAHVRIIPVNSRLSAQVAPWSNLT